MNFLCHMYIAMIKLCEAGMICWMPEKECYTVHLEHKQTYETKEDKT